MIYGFIMCATYDYKSEKKLGGIKLKTTSIMYNGINRFDGSMKFRDLTTNTVLYVMSYEDGEMYIKPMGGKSLEKFAGIACRCFDNDSDLKGIKKIVFQFNGVIIEVTDESANIETIMQKYMEIHKSHEKFRVM